MHEACFEMKKGFIVNGKCKNCRHAVHVSVVDDVTVFHNSTDYKSNFKRCDYRECGCRKAVLNEKTKYYR